MFLRQRYSLAEKSDCWHLKRAGQSETQDIFQITPLFNIGIGRDISIKELADIIMKIVVFKGKIIYDPDKPNGTLQKQLDVSKMRHEIKWQAKTSLKNGIQKTYHWYKENLN